MVQNRSDDPAVKSTLICAPVALLDQWKLEVSVARDEFRLGPHASCQIETKTEGAFNCIIYHGMSASFRLSLPYVLSQGPSKPKMKQELQKYDIILTTFQFVPSTSPLVPHI